jgi:hypothetical protein
MKVALYCDQPISTETLATLQKLINEEFDGGEPVLLHAQTVAGFQSGIDWASVMIDQAVNAVILVDVNDACAFGLSLEITSDSDMEVYEFFENELLDLRSLKVAGKKPYIRHTVPA